MGNTTLTVTKYAGPTRVRTTSAATPIAVRSRAHAGTPGAFAGELRLDAPTTASDDVFAPFPGTAAPGGPPA